MNSLPAQIVPVIHISRVQKAWVKTKDIYWAQEKGCFDKSAERQSPSHLTLTASSTHLVGTPDNLQGFPHHTLLQAPTWSEVKWGHNASKQQGQWIRFVPRTNTSQSSAPFILLENLFSREKTHRPEQNQNLDFPGVLLKARLQIGFVLWKSRIYTFIPTHAPLKLLYVEKPNTRCFLKNCVSEPELGYTFNVSYGT